MSTLSFDLMSHELLVLGLFSLSGISVAWWMGFRRAEVLVAAGVVVAALLRVLSLVLVFVTGSSASSFWVWVGLSILLLLVSVLRRRPDRDFFLSVGLGQGLVVASVLTKLVFGVGERHHSDSATIAANAVLLFARDEVPSAIRRGFSYPLLLALGREGEILTSITPYIFLCAVALTLGWSRRLARGLIDPRILLLGVGLFGLLLVSTPMVRVAVFYLNSHVLLALCLGLVLYGATTGLTGHDLNSGRNILLILMAGVLASLTRAEGFLLVWFVLLPLLQNTTSNVPVSRVRAWATYAMPAIAALTWVTLVAPNQLPVPVTVAWLTVGSLLAAVALLLSPWLQWLRARAIAVAVSLIWVVFVVIATVYVPADLAQMGLIAQVRNLFGAGGWGYLAPVMGLLVALFMIGRRTRLLWDLFLLVVGSVALTFVIKNFDGGGIGLGFGREGFWDSINRSWLHFLVLYCGVVMRSFAECFARPSRS